MIDFTPLRRGEKQIADIAEGLDRSDLHRLTDEMIDYQLSLITDAQDGDVVFVPVDPEAHDEFAQTPDELNMPWTLGHVIVHITASSEEAAARASQLARGVPVEGRNRSEIPWQSVSTIAQVRLRLEESRRMRHAFLETWPDLPSLSTLYQPRNPNYRPFNAVGMFLTGLSHDDTHLAQLKEIVRQAAAFRTL